MSYQYYQYDPQCPQYRSHSAYPQYTPYSPPSCPPPQYAPSPYAPSSHASYIDPAQFTHYRPAQSPRYARSHSAHARQPPLPFQSPPSTTPGSAAAWSAMSGQWDPRKVPVHQVPGQGTIQSFENDGIRSSKGIVGHCGDGQTSGGEWSAGSNHLLLTPASATSSRPGYERAPSVPQSLSQTRQQVPTLGDPLISLSRNRSPDPATGSGQEEEQYPASNPPSDFIQRQREEEDRRARVGTNQAPIQEPTHYQGAIGPRYMPTSSSHGSTASGGYTGYNY